MQKKSNASYWNETERPQHFPPLDRPVLTDAVVVGAGITGLTTAYLLTEIGKKVVVIDSGPVGGGDTGRTTAHLSTLADYGYSGIIRSHGEEASRIVAQSHARAIDLLEGIIQSEKIDCDFQRLNGYLFISRAGGTVKKEENQKLEEELESLSRAGVEAERTVLTCFPWPASGVLLRNQARFHPLKYLNGLARVLSAQGVEIFTGSHIREIKPEGVHSDSGFDISAENVVVATHAPVEGTLIFLKQAPYQSYVVAGRIPANTFPDALYWDTEDPYHYLRLQPLSSEEDLLMAGGEDHKTGQAPGQNYEDCFQRLQTWTRERFPQLKEFEYRWSGQIMEPVDQLPFIGRIPYRGRKIFMATGYSGNGMTYGITAACLIRDLIKGTENSRTRLFDPVRRNLHSLKDFFEENLNVVKNLTEDWVRKGDIVSADDLAPGEGGILQKGLTKLAVYRDDAGRVHTVSAICTHLGCIVKWNSAEKSFDCPCHGSRYSPTGEVLNGPAIKPLERKYEPIDGHQHVHSDSRRA